MSTLTTTAPTYAQLPNYVWFDGWVWFYDRFSPIDHRGCVSLKALSIHKPGEGTTADPARCRPCSPAEVEAIRQAQKDGHLFRFD